MMKVNFLKKKHCQGLLEDAYSGPFRRFSKRVWQNARPVLLGVRWCAMSMFLFLKFYDFNKGIIRIYSIFKNPKTNVFKRHLLIF